MTDVYVPAEDSRPPVALSDIQLAMRLVEGLTGEPISTDDGMIDMATDFATMVEAGRQFSELGPDRTREAITEAAIRMVGPLGFTVVKQEVQ